MASDAKQRRLSANGETSASAIFQMKAFSTTHNCLGVVFSALKNAAKKGVEHATKGRTKTLFYVLLAFYTEIFRSARTFS